MKPEECIFFQMAKANQAGTRFLTKALSGHEVTAVQALVLITLLEEDGIPSVNLGKQLKLDSATITGLMDRLESRGVIERRQNPDDRRSVLFFLTDQGRKTAEAVEKDIKLANRDFLARLTDEEAMIFRALLRKVTG